MPTGTQRKQYRGVGYDVCAVAASFYKLIFWPYSGTQRDGWAKQVEGEGYQLQGATEAVHSVGALASERVSQLRCRFSDSSRGPRVCPHTAVAG